MRRLYISVAAFVLTTVVIHGQTVFAPFVSRLKAETQGSSVVLTWKDSSDARGPLRIHRHIEEITDSNFADAKSIAEVPYGVGSYTDYPSDTLQYFYAVTVADETGKRYDLLIPFRNKTLSPRGVQELGSPEQIAARGDRDHCGCRCRRDRDPV